MLDQYARWIAEHVSDPYGACAEYTEAMVAAFPELKRVRGHYHCLYWGEQAHWWCETAAGEIVDPTAAQFPSGGLDVEDYEPWDNSRPEPTGKCPNCGDYVFDGGTCCCEECHYEYTACCRTPYRELRIERRRQA